MFVTHSLTHSLVDWPAATRGPAHKAFVISLEIFETFNKSITTSDLQPLATLVINYADVLGKL